MIKNAHSKKIMNSYLWFFDFEDALLEVTQYVST